MRSNTCPPSYIASIRCRLWSVGPPFSVPCPHLSVLCSFYAWVKVANFRPYGANGVSAVFMFVVLVSLHARTVIHMFLALLLVSTHHSQLWQGWRCCKQWLACKWIQSMLLLLLLLIFSVCFITWFPCHSARDGPVQERVAAHYFEQPADTLWWGPATSRRGDVLYSTTAPTSALTLDSWHPYQELLQIGAWGAQEQQKLRPKMPVSSPWRGEGRQFVHGQFKFSKLFVWKWV